MLLKSLSDELVIDILDKSYTYIIYETTLVQGTFPERMLYGYIDNKIMYSAFCKSFDIEAV